jgi:protein-tyrosine phosphatase
MAHSCHVGDTAVTRRGKKVRKPGNYEPIRVLFVCMGNICRSPTAEGVFAQLVSSRAPDLEIEIDSAGTHDYHIGSPPDRRTVAAAARRGIDLSTQRARQVEDADFSRFDLIVAMDRLNREVLRARSEATAHRRIRLLLEFAGRDPESDAVDVPDPYYGGPLGFEQVLDLIEEAAEGLLGEIARLERGARRG